MLSQQLLNYRLRITRDGRAILEEALGISIPTTAAAVGGALWRECLPGGMMDEECKALVFGLLKCAFKIVVNGNKSEVESKLDASILVPAVMEVHGLNVEGTHKGDRVMSQGKRAYGIGYKKFELIASGDGVFNSATVNYSGQFWKNLFHDQTGRAVLIVNFRLKYVGCFDKGKRSGPGTLSHFDTNSSAFFDYFIGEWKEDMPWSGNFFSAGSSDPIARMESGKHAALRAASTAPLSPPAAVATPLPPQPPFSPTPLSAIAALPAPTSQVSAAFAAMAVDVSPSLQQRAVTSKVQDEIVRKRAADQDYDEDEEVMLPAAATTATTGESPYDNTIDTSIPPEEACPLIKQVLQQPERPLTMQQSIEVLSTCIRYGVAHGQKMTDKQAVIVLGNTGAGKSTFVNYLAGCPMRSQRKSELGLKGIGKVISVVPPATEVMAIGHSKQSKTFMPDIATCDGITYCDCPGFLDNRGAEINIANAVNVRAALVQAQSVRVVILINYHSLKADRGKGFTDTMTICNNLFGTNAALGQHKDSFLIGISQVPTSGDDAVSLNELLDEFSEDTPEAVRSLKDRVFLFDPLDRPLEGGWNRDTCRQKILDLQPIKNPALIFKTVLLDSDEKKLVSISEEICRIIEQLLNGKEYAPAAALYQELARLGVIEHIAVERQIGKVTFSIGQFFAKCKENFSHFCHFEEFDAAVALLEDLRAALSDFAAAERGSPKEHARLSEVVQLQPLENLLAKARGRFEKSEKQRLALEKKLRDAEGQVERMLQALNEQKKAAEEQLQQLMQHFKSRESDFQKRIDEATAHAAEQQLQLNQELNHKLQQLQDQLAVAQSQEMQSKLAQQRKQLQREYALKQQQLEREREASLAAQAEQQQQTEAAQLQMQQQYEEKIRALEEKKQQLTSNTQKSETIAAEREFTTADKEALNRAAIAYYSNHNSSTVEALRSALNTMINSELRPEQVNDNSYGYGYVDGYTPLHIAARLGHTDAIEMLLRKGAAVNAAAESRYTPLHIAARSGHTDAIEMLLRKGAAIEAADKEGYTPLRWAARSGHTDAVEMLLRKGAAVNAADKWKRTPLHMAAISGHTDAIEMLLRKGAKIEATTTWKRTPLHSAARSGHTDAIEMLLRKGAAIEAADKNGCTPLHSAARLGLTDAIEMLLRKGAKIEAADKDGYTPLYNAALFGHTDAVEMLLRKGAKIEAADKWGDTPLDVARLNGNTAAVAVLEKWGANSRR